MLSKIGLKDLLNSVKLELCGLWTELRIFFCFINFNILSLLEKLESFLSLKYAGTWIKYTNSYSVGYYEKTWSNLTPNGQHALFFRTFLKIWEPVWIWKGKQVI